MNDRKEEAPFFPSTLPLSLSLLWTPPTSVHFAVVVVEYGVAILDWSILRLPLFLIVLILRVVCFIFVTSLILHDILMDRGKWRVTDKWKGTKKKGKKKQNRFHVKIK